MQRLTRFLPAAVVTLALLAVAAYGYLRPEAEPSPPVRVLLINTGGPVVFDHVGHIRTDKSGCLDCHHTSKPGDEKPQDCGVCHAKAFDEPWIEAHRDNFTDRAACISCHHLEYVGLDKAYSHDLHAKEYLDGDCRACHHDRQIEPEPLACKACHLGETAGPVPSLRDAVHANCSECHQDMFETGLQGCATCHVVPQDMSTYQGKFTGCRACHEIAGGEPIPLPKRGEAFHLQCMTCHEQRGKGPFGEKDCFKCHIL